ACERSSQWQQALEVMGSLPDRGLRPDLVTCNIAMSACVKGHQWLNALHLLAEVPSHGLQADAVTFSAGIKACQQ
ncbi:unnamed protein product, partial [Polarella glacialis]